MNLHYCSRRCRRLRGRSSPGCRWRHRRNPAPSSGGWSSLSDGSRTGGNPPSTACTAEERSGKKETVRRLNQFSFYYSAFSHVFLTGREDCGRQSLFIFNSLRKPANVLDEVWCYSVTTQIKVTPHNCHICSLQDIWLIWNHHAAQHRETPCCNGAWNELWRKK